MELNLWSLIYLAYRVAPLMIVIYFIFASVINQDFKGLIYLIGLILACFLVHFMGNSFPADWILYDIDLNSPVCNSFSIGQNGYYSNKFPFSVVVFGYTFFYILYIIINYGLIFSNIPFLVLFPFLILFDLNRKIAFIASLASILTLSPFVLIKFIYHDQTYIFFMLLSSYLLLAYIKTENKNIPYHRRTRRCEFCGSKYTLSNKSRHERSTKHFDGKYISTERFEMT
jgi:hypothetical protein